MPGRRRRQSDDADEAEAGALGVVDAPPLEDPGPDSPPEPDDEPDDESGVEPDDEPDVEDARESVR